MANVNVVTIQVKAGSQVLSSGAFEAALASGQSDTFYVSVPLGEDLSAYQTLTVEVSASGYTDHTPENNSASLTLRLSDLSVEGAVASSDGSTTQVRALVVNRGQTNLGDLTVKVYDSDGTTLLATQTVAAPPVGEGSFVTLQVASGLENNRFLTVEATAAGLDPLEENLASNNSSIAVVKGPRAAAFTLAVSASANEDGSLSAIVDVSNTTEETKAYDLYVAAYSADGQMLASRVLTGLETASGGTELKQVDFSSSGAAYVRAFALGAGYVPLTASAEDSL